ncbi:MAG: hypothetical protein HYX46_05080 [Betaproteobacteria bacterium]|nr:hypothetical protein [Betaproteobacteria bacterium]
MAIAYACDLSKRTSMAVAYANIRNDAGASYKRFGVALGSIGTAAPSATLQGEDPQLLPVTLRQAF